MYGIRLLGMPSGSSPMSPDWCAPAGLKYRRRETAQAGSAAATSIIIFSTAYLVVPYGLVHSPILAAHLSGDQEYQE